MAFGVHGSVDRIDLYKGHVEKSVEGALRRRCCLMSSEGRAALEVIGAYRIQKLNVEALHCL